MPVDLESKSSEFSYTQDDVHKILANHGKKLKDLEIDLESIKEWFKTQPHIPDMPRDKLIVFYLLMNKFSIEKTKSRLEMNYSIRNVMPEFYNYTPMHPKIRESCKYLKINIIPKLTDNLRRLFIVKYEGHSSFDITIILSRMIMGMELLALYDFNDGDEYISDCTNLNLSIVTKIKPTDVMKCVGLFDKVYANRFSVMHTVNLPAAGEKLFNIFKACMKPKLRERLIFHRGIESLQLYYSKEMLPKDYGGTAKSLDEASADYQRFLERHDAYLSKWMQMHVNEKLRPQPLVNDEILGFYGNFKQLDVD